MLKNYCFIALRTLRRQKAYAAINVLGLALGLACAVLIAAFVAHEVSYDRHVPHAERVHRIVSQGPDRNFMGASRFGVVPRPLAPTLASDLPEIDAATALIPSETLIATDGTSLLDVPLLWVDDAFADVFGLPLLQGDAATALAEPHSVVLTEGLAQTLFGDADALGQTVQLSAQEDAYTVTGVIADPPTTSTLDYAFLAPVDSQDDFTRDLDSWRNSRYAVFFRLSDGTTADAVQDKMPALVDTYLYADSDTPPEERIRYEVEALLDIHLHATSSTFDFDTRGDVARVQLFALVAVVILLLACVNYTNLAVARSIKRAREVGVRKAVGGRRAQIVAQFLGESVLMVTLALALGLVLAHALLPTFGHLVERPLTLDYTSGWLVLGLLTLVLVVGLVSGSYPALFMARLEPMQVLKGRGHSGSTRTLLQRLLIVGQYAAAIVLVVGSLVVYQQLRFVQTADVGYAREHVVVAEVPHWSLRPLTPAIRDAWTRDAAVLAATEMAGLPTSVGSRTTYRRWEGSPEDAGSIGLYQTLISYDALDVFGIDLAAGRSFSRDFATDTTGAVLVNETAVRAMGWTPEEALGRWFGFEERRIIGVVEDFHFHSLHLPIEPLMLRLGTDGLGTVAARVQPGDLPGTLARLQATTAAFTDYPIEVTFLDAAFDQLYRADRRLGQTFGFFTVVALLIASLGLFGLAAFAAEQRTKEIGIRKVLGADVLGLVRLLSLDFVKLVLLAFMVAVPISYVVMQRWLADFAYRIELGPGLFLVAGGGALVIALAAVSVQALRAATAEPVRSLRYE